VGGEFGSGIDMVQSPDIPLRYAFRRPKKGTLPGSTWTLTDRLFGDFATEIGPLDVAGAYRMGHPRKLKITDVLKAARGEKKEWPTQEAVVVEGIFTGARGNWLDNGTIGFEKNPSVNFRTTAVYRTEDGALLGAGIEWDGRTLLYPNNFSASGVVSRKTIARQYFLLEPVVELDPAALKGRIDQALGRSVRWLKSSQSPEGTFTDPPLLEEKWNYARGFLTAASLAALTHAGVPADDPAVVAGFRWLCSRKLIMTWDLGLALMALESKYLPLLN
jgi:hypothetical protein